MSYQFKKGRSDNQDSFEAIRELASQISLPDASVTMIFISSKHDLLRISNAIKTFFTGTIISCTTSGEISDNGYSQNSVCGFSFAGDELQVTTYAIPQVRNPDMSIIKNTVNNIKDVLIENRRNTPERKHFGLFLIDGLSRMEEHLAATFGNALSEIAIIGGSAGDDLSFDKCMLFINGEYQTDTALFCLFSTSLPFSVFKSQHFLPSDTRLVITGAIPHERIVSEINGIGASQEYSRIAGIPVNQLGPAVFSRFPLILKHSGDSHVRSIQKLNSDGSLTFFCAIDEGVVLRVAERQDISQCLADSFGRVESDIGTILFTIGFDCILRRLESYEFGYDSKIRKIFQKHNVTGFCTYGEQINSIHVNQTFTGVAIGVRHEC